MRLRQGNGLVERTLRNSTSRRMRCRLTPLATGSDLPQPLILRHPRMMRG